MDGGDTAVVDPAVFDRNLTALREVDPQQADLLASFPIPNTVIPFRGRDGSVTFRVCSDDGCEHWFGGTSAPTVSAPALLSAFDPGRGNVLLRGIGQGAEAALLLQRFEPHRGVLVLETDPLSLSLALRLRDFSQDIRGMRLALILSPAGETEVRLCAFFARYVGYCCPERILIWPWHTSADVQALRLVVERCAASADQERSLAVSEIQGRWRKEPPAELPATPRVAIVSRVAGPAVWEWGQQAAADGRELGWTTEAFSVRGPADCHILRLAQGLETFRPDWVLAVRATRDALRAAVAPSIPIVSWFDSVGAANASWAGGGRADAVAVTSAAVGRRLPREGMPKGRLAVVPCAAPHVAEPSADEADRPYDVVVLLDVAPANAVEAGINLHTQQVLWREAVGVIRRELDSFTHERAEPVLAGAEGRAKMALHEPAIRSAFVQLIAEAIGPTTVAVELARQLVAAGLAVHVWGGGWGSHGIAGLHHHGAPSTPAEIRATLCKTRLYVCPGVGGEVGRDVLEAVAAGAVVVWRQHPADNDGGGIRTLFAEGAEFLSFRTASELVRTCQTVLGDPRMCERIRGAAVERLRREHAMSSRLAALQALATASL